MLYLSLCPLTAGLFDLKDIFNIFNKSVFGVEGSCLMAPPSLCVSAQRPGGSDDCGHTKHELQPATDGAATGPDRSLYRGHKGTGSGVFTPDSGLRPCTRARGAAQTLFVSR